MQGLIDLFKHYLGFGAQEPSGDASQGGPSVRQMFAHRALPAVAFENPAGFLFAMSDANPDRQAILRDLWEQVRAQCPWGTARAKAPAAFPTHPFLLCGNCGVVIEMPEPQRPPEAYFVASVVRLPAAGEPPPATPPQSWFFTLEKVDDMFSALLPRGGLNRLVNSLRGNPKLLTTLLGETMFRGAFLRDVSEKMLPALRRDPVFCDIFMDILRNPDALVNDPTRFAHFLDEYDRRMPTSSTILGRWTNDGTHENFGPGSRPDSRSFIADLAVWFSTTGTCGSGPNSSHRPVDDTGR
jgi:hypothetical protein